MWFRTNDTPLVYSFKFQDKVTSMKLRIKKIFLMSRHSSALLLSVIHKKILISAFLMHIDVSINWRKSIHKNNFLWLKSQKNCTNNRVFPIGREWGELPLLPHQPKTFSFPHLDNSPAPVDSPHQIFIPSPPKDSPPHRSLVVLHYSWSLPANTQTMIIFNFLLHKSTSRVSSSVK